MCLCVYVFNVMNCIYILEILFSTSHIYIFKAGQELPSWTF